MKKIILLLLAITTSSISFAQWKVSTTDNGFDPAFTKAVCWSNNEETGLLLEKSKTGVVLNLYCDFDREYSATVKMILKVKGVDKNYEFKGIPSSRKPCFFIVPKGGALEDFSKIWTDDFLSDFKNSTTLRIQIKNSEDSEIYEFKMGGSTKAYQSVSNQ